MEKRRKVSFDFDGTLDRESVQKYAKELVEKGFEVWIVTARFDSKEAYTKEFIEKYGIVDIEREHARLFEIADTCGISRDHIKFTNMELKSEFFKDNPDFMWHLDDDWIELRVINTFTRVTAISATSSAWRHKCDRYIRMS